MRIYFFYNSIILTALLIFGSATVTHAAVVRATQVSNENSIVVVDVMLDTNNASVNAIEGSLSYPADTLSLVSVSTIDSIVGLWIDRPADNDGTLSWSGAIPGGFKGVRNEADSTLSPGRLFRLTFRAIDADQVTIAFKDVKLYKNDATATPVSTSTTPLVVTVASGDGAPVVEQIVDSFTARLNATITRDESIEEGKWFAVFTADTTRVSIDHYEVVESTKKNYNRIATSVWQRAESPYILSHQSRNRYVHIKAVATNGSSYVTTIDPVVHSAVASVPMIVWSILIALVLLAILRNRKFIARLLKKRSS